MNLLIVGPTEDQSVESIGGTTILMETLLQYCSDNNINFMFIKSNKYKMTDNLYKIRNQIRVIYLFLKKVLKSDVVMVNAASNLAFYTYPLLLIFTLVFKKNIVLRLFGGNFIELYEKKSRVTRWLYKEFFLKKSTVVFCETKKVLYFMKEINQKSYWYPNVRLRNKEEFKKRTYSKKYLFISQVKKTKGVDEIICSNKILEKNGYTIHVYGPILDQEYSTNSYFMRNIYKGVLSFSEVNKTLNDYDVLLLPSYHSGEGYPGIIIEAYRAGVPVISTFWQSIPEIVDHEKTGLLIKPNACDELISAILSITNDRLHVYSKNAKAYFNNFDAERVNKNIVSIMEASRC